MYNNLIFSKIGKYKIAIDKNFINGSIILGGCSISQLKRKRCLFWKFTNIANGLSGVFINLEFLISNRVSIHYNQSINLLNIDKKKLPHINVGIVAGSLIQNLVVNELYVKMSTAENKKIPLNINKLLFPNYLQISKNDYIYILDFNYLLEKFIYSKIKK